MENKLQAVQELVNGLGVDIENISDGYHTFSELYEFRKLYNALIFNEWAKQITRKTAFSKDAMGRTTQIVVGESNTFDVHKSLRHHDGELCFGGGWFVVVAVLPTGQITNHYEMKDWDLFKVPEVEKAKYEFDGHTSQDVLFRMSELIKFT